MSATPGGDARRKAEIEAKRAKLAELRRQREERSGRLQSGRGATTSAGAAAGPSSEPSAILTGATTARKDLHDLVANLVGSPSTPSGPRSARPSMIPQLGSSYSSPRKSVAAGPGIGSGSEFGGSDSVMGPGTTLVSKNEVEGDAAGPSGQSSLRGLPDLVDVETELFEYPQKERVYYTKEVQTMSTWTDETEQDGKGVGVGAESSTSAVSAATEAAIRRKILEEQELERERQAQESLKRQEEELERQLQEELRILSPEEAKAIFGTTDFSDFVESSSKIVERALTDAYDYLKDYTIVGSAADVSEGRDIKQLRCFWDEKLCKGRSITGLDWSSKHPELVVASYSRSEQGGDSPDGLVLVWNIHLLDRPEFIFEAQTDVLSAVFSPFHPNLVIGGTYSGQILIWDTRAKQLPVLKTPLGAAGHTHPVYNIQVVGTQNANHLITASTDGLVCTWMLDMLAQPQESLELLNSNQPKTDEVAITCLDFPVQETTQFWVGTEEGNIYLASRFDRAGSKAGLQLGEVYKGHAAPITGIDFHKASALQGSADFSDLFLSSSMDWTAKLWRIKSSISSSNGGASGRSVSSSLPAGTSARLGLSASSASSSSSEIVPLLSFEEASDYVMDVKWHRASPSLFALADASGQVHLYNLLHDSERPLVSSTLSSQGLNKLSFDRATAGKHLAVGGVDGRVHVLEIGSVVGSVFGSVEKDAQEMQRLLSATARSSGTGTGVVAAPVRGGMTNGAVGL